MEKFDGCQTSEMSNMHCVEEKHTIIEIKKRILSQRINLIYLLGWTYAKIDDILLKLSLMTRWNPIKAKGVLVKSVKKKVLTKHWRHVNITFRGEKHDT